MLKAFEVNQEVWNKIVYNHQAHIHNVESLREYKNGYKDKARIMLCGNELIIREYILNYYCHNIQECTDWKQCIVRLNENAITEITDSITGTKAVAYINKVLHDYYNDIEIDCRLNMFTAEYDKSKGQYHYNYPAPMNEIIKIDNCVEYDINGAHLDALCEIFPKAKDRLIKMYNMRKKNPIYKKYPNFYVGMLVRRDHRPTYNWIVQRTTKKLFEAMDYTKGSLVYANTDGYIITCPDKKLVPMSSLGAFKCEWEGSAYIYRDKNYQIVQKDDEIKGSMFKSVRNMVDLRQGIVVHYDIHCEKAIGLREPINITQEKL